MTTKIATEGIDSAPNVKLHFIPAETDGSGPTKVKKFFEDSTKSNENGDLINSLRGYPLIGGAFALPDTHRGFVITPAKSDSATMKISGKFEDFTFWNYDLNPSKNDSLRQAMDWMDISKALHGD